jgi:hypothetical protein
VQADRYSAARNMRPPKKINLSNPGENPDVK